MVPIFLKQLLYKALGPKLYLELQYLGKIRDITQKKVFEKELYLLPMIVHKGETAVDVGANYAVYSYHLSKAVGETGHVYAFEPIPFTHRVCEKLLKHFNLRNVRLLRQGCGNFSGKTIFETPLQSFGAISAGQAHLGGRINDMDGKERHYKFKAAAKVECDIVRLDDALPQLDNVSFMKLDIEGAEYFALQGAAGLINKNYPIILCEINPFFLKGFGIDLKEFLDFMAGLGYRLYFYTHQEGHHRLAETKMEEVEENNYLFIHPCRMDRFKAIRQDT